VLYIYSILYLLVVLMMIITSGAPTASQLISRNTVQITEVSQQICSNVSPYYNSTTGYVGCRLAFARL